MSCKVIIIIVKKKKLKTDFYKNVLSDVSSGLASSGEFSSLLNRLAIEVPPADRTLTPGRASAPGLPFQSSSNPFAATFDRDWQNQGGHFEDTLINRRNPFDSEGLYIPNIHTVFDDVFKWSVVARVPSDNSFCPYILPKMSISSHLFNAKEY